MIQEKIDEEEAFRARTAVSAANREKRKGQANSSHQEQRRGTDDRNSELYLAFLGKKIQQMPF